MCLSGNFGWYLDLWIGLIFGELKVMEDDEYKDKKDSKHKEIENYFKLNGGVNLQLLESNLKIFSFFNEPQVDVNEEQYKYLSEYERMCKLLDEDIVPIYKTKADLTCFNSDDDALVIVEIKSKSEVANHKTLGQILYYITVEKNNLNNAKSIKHETGEEVKSVRGIILAHENNLNDSLKVLIKEYENKLPKIKLKTYHWTDKRKLIINDE